MPSFFLSKALLSLYLAWKMFEIPFKIPSTRKSSTVEPHFMWSFYIGKQYDNLFFADGHVYTVFPLLIKLHFCICCNENYIVVGGQILKFDVKMLYSLYTCINHIESVTVEKCTT